MPKCLDSLLEQDILPSDYEIILVNDGSTDNSLSMANEYQNRSEESELFPKIKIVNQENKGLAAARNAGVDVAEGKYLCFVDPDDYIEKNSLNELLSIMEEKNLDILRFNYQKVDEEYNNLPDFQSEAEFDYSKGIMTGIDFLKNRLGIACYVWPYIYRLDLIKSNNIRFIETCYFDDTPWLPRVMQKAQRVECIPVRHQYYLQRQGSMVRTNNIDSIKRKVDGQVKLLTLLKEQVQVAYPEVLGWYKRMSDHIVISILTTVAVSLFLERDKYIRQIEAMKLLPLANSNRLKCLLINISPSLYCWMIYMKNYRK
jgi:glycosyltransferase involved in cell wall biosynthesis